MQRRGCNPQVELPRLQRLIVQRFHVAGSGTSAEGFFFVFSMGPASRELCGRCCSSNSKIRSSSSFRPAEEFNGAAPAVAVRSVGGTSTHPQTPLCLSLLREAPHPQKRCPSVLQSPPTLKPRAQPLTADPSRCPNVAL